MCLSTLFIVEVNIQCEPVGSRYLCMYVCSLLLLMYVRKWFIARRVLEEVCLVIRMSVYVLKDMGLRQTADSIRMYIHAYVSEAESRYVCIISGSTVHTYVCTYSACILSMPTYVHMCACTHLHS